MLSSIKGSKPLIVFTVLLLVFCGGILVYLLSTNGLNMPQIAIFWMSAWLCLTIVLTAWSYQNFVIGYLLGMFTMLISWRIAAIYSIDALTYPLLLVFILYMVNFIYCASSHLRHQKDNRISIAEWQIIFIRIYMGFDFIPHFTEKLFAGSAPHLNDVNAFIALGVPDPGYFVWLAGLCELSAAVALGLGLFMRIGALGSVFYLLIAASLGHHFSLGFIWANPGGGWEFTVMWCVIMLSFVITGSHRFSVDQYLEEHFSFPQLIKKLM